MNRQQRRAQRRPARAVPTPRRADLGEVAREALKGLAWRRGTRWKTAAVVAPHGTVRECWSNAWHGEGEYVEGVVSRTRPDGTVTTGTHAWNLVDGQVVERTPTYEQAFDYVGVVIDREPHLAKTGDWGSERGSIVETLYGAGLMHLGHLLVDDDVLTFLKTGEPPR